MNAVLKVYCSLAGLQCGVQQIELFTVFGEILSSFMLLRSPKPRFKNTHNNHAQHADHGYSI